MQQIPIDAYLDGFSPVVRATADKLRRLVRDAEPNVIERVRLGWHLIGYDLPLRRYGLYFAYVAPEADHVHLGFEYGVFMDDPRGLLQGAGLTKQLRWITVASPEQIDTERTIELVREGARVAALTRDERLALVLDRSAGPA